ncbi:hypothetical protein RHA1_ro10110 (plasmid) [Rhodococcus jostii RHA1]|uniref:Uncharacterized protein n=1 Tax=Rhodococcus jostii (strain RHA1) TaxID=101510 RepID=Q0RWN3_RHOJR|nr:hypothetical protein RHA1_ro10110 [Rhodococcus jostii RHA1]
MDRTGNRTTRCMRSPQVCIRTRIYCACVRATAFSRSQRAGARDAFSGHSGSFQLDDDKRNCLVWLEHLEGVSGKRCALTPSGTRPLRK